MVCLQEPAELWEPPYNFRHGGRAGPHLAEDLEAEGGQDPVLRGTCHTLCPLGNHSYPVSINRHLLDHCIQHSEACTCGDRDCRSSPILPLGSAWEYGLEVSDEAESESLAWGALQP